MIFTACEKSVLGRSLKTYAVGLVRMAATGLGVLGAFSFCVLALRGQLTFGEGLTSAGELIGLVVVFCIGWRDKPGTPEGQLKSKFLWLFYLLLCLHLIFPLAIRSSENPAGKWAWIILFSGVLVGFQLITTQHIANFLKRFLKRKAVIGQPKTGAGQQVTNRKQKLQGK